MACEHKEITMANVPGKEITGVGREVDFVILCDNCREELFRISELKRNILNISKH